MNFIDKYFIHTEEYPKNVALNPIPWGVFWEYISTTFLEGFVNYCEKILCGFVMARYRRWDEQLEYPISIQDPPGSFFWTKFNGTKREVFEKLTEPNRIVHAKLDSVFGDDVIILGRLGKEEKNTSGTYIVFWFDRDCSDSAIGRFASEEAEETIINDFKAWCRSLELDIEDERAKEIPLHYFTGWISS